MSSLADRLIELVRSEERVRPYVLERPDVQSEATGDVWLLHYMTPTGDRPWGQAGEGTRRRVIRRWYWLRWLHRADWLARGGRDA